MIGLRYDANSISDLTTQLKNESTPRKKIPNIVVMISTITTVTIVSRPVGQTTFAVSARTCRMNSPGVVFAIALQNPKMPRQHRPAAGKSGLNETLMSGMMGAISRITANGKRCGADLDHIRRGRGGGTRTHGPRFWRPMLYQLSYTPTRRMERVSRRAGGGAQVLLRHWNERRRDYAARVWSCWF
jgi:hypothetical protein